MSGVNKVILLGRLGTDPDLKHTQSGAAVCKFSLATSETFVGKDGNRQETTEWHKIVCWNKSAEIAAQYLSKGRQVYIEGKITTVSWDDKQSGQKRYATEIVAQNIQFIGDASKQQGQGQQGQQGQQRQGQQRQYQQTPDETDPSWQAGYTPGIDDIPF